MGSASIDAYVVGSGRPSGRRSRTNAGGIQRHLNLRPIPAAGAALSLSRHRETPHHVLDARTGLRTVGRFARANAAPIVATFHDGPDREPSWLRDRVTAAILVSEAQRAAFRDTFPSERTFVVPYGVDTERFAPNGTSSVSGRVAVSSVACDDALLARASDLARQQLPDAAFTRVGGDDAARLASYRSSAVVLFPLSSVIATHELLEAMAAGAPIVATDVGAVREYVDRAALLVPPRDPQALSDAVVRVLRDRELAAELGRRARARALQFDLATAASRHRAIYRWCQRNGDAAGANG